MSIYTVSPFVAYDHEQGMFMFYGDFPGGMKLVPQHFIDEVEETNGAISIICNNKHRRESFLVESDSPDEDIEKIIWLKEEF